ncbi:MAG: DedA family protein [Gemmatimonadaceae bacterium]
MHSTITQLLESNGYLFLFLLVGLESLGVPLPGETALVSAAAYAALGHLDIYVVIATATVAAIAGDNGGYWIGRKGGISLVRRFGRFVHLNETHLDRARKFFERHGAKTVFIGRFIALLRTWAALLAGAGCMQYGKFMLFNALGAVTWAALFGTLGYVFGRNLPLLEHYIGRATVAILIVAIIVVGFALARRKRASGQVPNG